jgi:hypothetical protein
MPEVTASVSPPRVAAIEYPLGRSFGQPGDIAGQTAVLRVTLQTLSDINEAGTVVHLPFTWPEPRKEVHAHPQEPPPISKAIMRRPWLYRKLLAGDIPKEYK